MSNKTIKNKQIKEKEIDDWYIRQRGANNDRFEKR